MTFRLFLSSFLSDISRAGLALPYPSDTELVDQHDYSKSVSLPKMLSHISLLKSHYEIQAMLAPRAGNALRGVDVPRERVRPHVLNRP